MIILKLLFVAASLLTQAWIFRDPKPDAPAPSITQVTLDPIRPAVHDSSPAESDSSRTGETWTLR
jgi:hypothetical protein